MCESWSLCCRHWAPSAVPARSAGTPQRLALLEEIAEAVGAPAIEAAGTTHDQKLLGRELMALREELRVGARHAAARR